MFWNKNKEYITEFGYNEEELEDIFLLKTNDLFEYDKNYNFEVLEGFTTYAIFDSLILKPEKIPVSFHKSRRYFKIAFVRNDPVNMTHYYLLQNIKDSDAEGMTGTLKYNSTYIISAPDENNKETLKKLLYKNSLPKSDVITKTDIIGYIKILSDNIVTKMKIENESESKEIIRQFERNHLEKLKNAVNQIGLVLYDQFSNVNILPDAEIEARKNILTDQKLKNKMKGMDE